MKSLKLLGGTGSVFCHLYVYMLQSNLQLYAYTLYSNIYLCLYAIQQHISVYIQQHSSLFICSIATYVYVYTLYSNNIYFYRYANIDIVVTYIYNEKSPICNSYSRVCISVCTHPGGGAGTSPALSPEQTQSRLRRVECTEAP